MVQPIGHPVRRSRLVRDPPGSAPTADPGSCFDCPVTGDAWDAHAYDSRFGFVALHGDALLDVLDPQPGDRVLDVGCGTGRHAAMIAARGADVLGLDADPGMLAKARTDHPELTFVRADARTVTLADLGMDSPFDGCLSNAALHWMSPQDGVLRNLRGLLRPGARFVAEMGGAGNIAALDDSLRGALVEVGLPGLQVPENFFPTVGVESVLLEGAGFRVEHVSWFRRPTPLGQGSSVADWTRQFRAGVWAQVPPGARADLAAEIDAQAQRRGLHRDGTWIADYCRLRFMAVAVD
jgi:SAM-dependent methyltransferase